MSDPESFLSRWSRLKQESNSVGQPESAAAAAEVTNAEAGAPLPAVFDPASLPSIASINQATDIRQFLQAGVPAEWVRDALRAAWATDPTIRDFIGIADSQWDFNDPHAMPGFGPLEAADSARGFAARSVARMSTTADAIERVPDLGTRAAVDAANLPRDGQVDGVWLSAGRTEGGPSRPITASLPAEPPRSVAHSAAEPDPVVERTGPRVHGTALPKVRT